MNRSTKQHQFSTKTRKKIRERDNNACIFCTMGYPAKDATWIDLQPADIMHYIPRSQGGLGIEQNGAVGCRYHHSLMDNGNKGLRPDMLMRFENYLRNIYPGWDKKDLIYDKYKIISRNPE